MKIMAIGVLLTMATGMVANGIVTWRKVGVNDQRINTLEKTSEKQDNKIDQIHWYLIERQGIKVPKGK